MSCDDIMVKAALMPVCLVVGVAFLLFVFFYAALSERIKMYLFDISHTSSIAHYYSPITW